MQRQRVGRTRRDHHTTLALCFARTKLEAMVVGTWLAYATWHRWQTKLCRVSTALVVSQWLSRVLCSLATRVHRQRQLQGFSCGRRLHLSLRCALAWSSETRWQQRARRAQSAAQHRWVVSALACPLAHWRSGVAQIQRILVSAEERRQRVRQAVVVLRRQKRHVLRGVRSRWAHSAKEVCWRSLEV